MKNKLRTKDITFIAMLSALATIIMSFEFPLLPFAPFLKLDLSDVVVVISAFVLGPEISIIIALLKVTLHWLLTGSGIPGLIGNLTSFIASISFVLPLVFKENKITFRRMILATILLTGVTSILNYFVMLPLYMKVFNFEIGMPISKYIVTTIVPFNLLKGLIISSVSLLLLSKLKRLISKMRGSL